jgi:hypothetical protein
MNTLNGLVSSLNVYLGWNKARMDCFAKMLLGLISARTVNLQEIAVFFKSEAKVSSRYRRLQRFFALFEIDLTLLARWIFKLFFSQCSSYYLIIDRTNWRVGKKNINVFMLAVAYEGLAIPLFWSLLDKQGSSHVKEQKALIFRFINTFGTQGIAGLLGDREFGSGKLFEWLSKKKIPFYIRIKEGSSVGIKNKKLFPAKKLFNDLHLKRMKFFNMSVEIFEKKVFIAAARSERGELMIVVTNQHPRNAIAIYLRRWEIENLFQGLKSRGFLFESTHMTHQERIAKLIALLAVGFVWAHKVGEWYAIKNPIVIKHFQHNQRPQHTFFRYGLNFLRTILADFHKKPQQILLKQCIKLLCFDQQEAIP